MQAKTMIPMLLLIAVAGCARSADATDPAAAATTAQAGSPAAEPAAAATDAAATPAPADASEPGPAGTTSPPRQDAPTDGRDAPGQSQGIRVGEPAPDAPGGPRNPAPGAGWHAFGNEPFWSVQARGGTLVFTTPDDQDGVTLLGRRVPSLVGTVILGSGPKGEFHLGVTPGKCSDGMSDRSYDFASTFIYGGITYKGCAEPVEAR
jgi:uncharacterized membrane protein